MYPHGRWQVFEAAFIAYATFYLVRNNFAPVSKEMGDALHYDKGMIGNILAGTALAYGIGKFVMGCLADRCDARKYVATGMLLTAALNFMFGAVREHATYTLHWHLYWVNLRWTLNWHVLLWTLNGFVQGMGYGPCTRGLSHWYGAKERGAIFGFWNTSHNVGGGIAGYLAAQCAAHWGWASAFYVPGAIATVCAIYLFWRMRDTPQSVGLPPIEEYQQTHAQSSTIHHPSSIIHHPPSALSDPRPIGAPKHREGGSTLAPPSPEPDLTLRELLLKYILPNKMLWILALANVFVYIARYAMVDWGPTYLKEIKGATLVEGGWSTLIIEFAGGAGMLTMGWLSDKLGGLRGRVSVFAMIPLLFAFAAIRVTPKGMLWLDLTLLGLIGFLVYTPVMFSGVMSLDLTTKKAVGTAAGFVGLFGYIGRVIQGKGLGWIAQRYGWDPALWAVLGCTFAGIILLAFTWNVRPGTEDADKKVNRE
ncbi:MAG: MFS transporter [Verrucomicrobia bacterium]|nr:MAG: MFS transporter [Verrucomicrobiota bacterium]